MTALTETSEPPSQDLAALVRQIAEAAGPEGLEYREVLRRADRRGFGVFIVLAAVLLLLPIDVALPQIAALILIVCGLGLLTNARAPWLPGLGKRRASRAALEKLANFLHGQQSWSHLLVSPRFADFARGAGERTAGVGVLLLGLCVATPMPDAIPGLGALALGLGLLQRDGLVMLIGTAVAFGWTAFLATMLAGLAAHAPYALGWAHDHAAWLADRFSPPPTGP